MLPPRIQISQRSGSDQSAAGAADCKSRELLYC
ncbi:hypothetical protein WP1_292 [Pseudomonas phage WP1]